MDDEWVGCLVGLAVIVLAVVAAVYCSVYIGMTLIIAIDFISRPFTLLGITDVSESWLCTGILCGASIGLAEGFKRSGRQTKAPIVYGVGVGLVGLLCILSSQSEPSRLGVREDSQPPSHLQPNALVGVWRGTVSNDRRAELAIVASSTTDRLQGSITYEGVKETLAPEIRSDGTVVLQGTAYRRLSGSGSFALDTFVARLSPDQRSMSGTYRDQGGKSGVWSVIKVSHEPEPAVRRVPDHKARGPAAVSRAALFDDFANGSVGDAHGIDYVSVQSIRGAEFRREHASRIEYRSIPREGTLEFWINVSSGYSYDNFQLHEKQDRALVFSTDIQGGDVTWPGATTLFVFANGAVSFRMAIAKYDRPPAKALVATGTRFRFNEWHALGVSYGSRGEYIMVDGVLAAQAPEMAQALGSAGNHSMPLDVPTLGETVSNFWPHHRYEGGFEGTVLRVRASNAQVDWFLARGIGD